VTTHCDVSSIDCHRLVESTTCACATAEHSQSNLWTGIDEAVGHYSWTIVAIIICAAESITSSTCDADQSICSATSCWNTISTLAIIVSTIHIHNRWFTGQTVSGAGCTSNSIIYHGNPISNSARKALNSVSHCGSIWARQTAWICCRTWLTYLK